MQKQHGIEAVFVDGLDDSVAHGQPDGHRIKKALDQAIIARKPE